jgi:hypothetical protein
MRNTLAVAIAAALIGVASAGATATAQMSHHGMGAALYRALLTTKITPAELTAGSALLSVEPLSPIDLRVLSERMDGELGYSATRAVVIRTTAGYVVLLLMPNDGDAEALLGHILLANGPATYVGDLVGASKGSNTADVFDTGTGVAGIGTVFLLAIPADSDPGTAADLLELGVKHLRDAEHAV